MQQQAPQIRVLNAAVLQQLQTQQQTEGGATVVAGQAQVARESLAIPSPAAVQQQQQPQVITLSQLQNFLPIHHQSGQHHVTAVASTESTVQNQQTAPGAPGVKTFASSAVTPAVVSVQGVSGQFLQVCLCHFLRHGLCHSRGVRTLTVLKGFLVYFRGYPYVTSLLHMYDVSLKKGKVDTLSYDTLYYNQSQMLC